MTRPITILFLLGSLALGLVDPAAALETTEALQRSGRAVVGEAAPFLSGWTASNKVFSTTKVFKDQSIRECVLVFWASWCPPCLNGMKMLSAAENRFADRGIQIVLVNYSETLEKVQEFLEKYPQPYPIVIDRWQKSSETYLADEKGAVALPRTVLIDRAGLVKAIFSTEGEDYVERILAGE